MKRITSPIFIRDSRPRFLAFQLLQDPRQEHHRQQHRIGDLASRLHGAVEDFQHFPEVRRAVARDRFADFGEQRFEQAAVDEQPDRAARPAAAEQIEDLLRHARRRRFQDVVLVAKDRVVRRRLDLESEARGEFDGAHHPDRDLRGNAHPDRR